MIFNKTFLVDLHNNAGYKLPKKTVSKNPVMLTDNSEKKHYPNYFNREILDIENSLGIKVISPFSLFFKNLNINTPQKLNSIKSLGRLKGLTVLKTLVRYLLKNGKKINSMKVLSSSLNSINLLKNTKISFWKNIYLTITFFFKLGTVYKIGSKAITLNTDNNFNFYNDELSINVEESIDNLILSSIKRFNFLFSFYIYKVDKNIYKNSRGRSGKYTFIWKYVAPYKRNMLIMH